MLRKNEVVDAVNQILIEEDAILIHGAWTVSNKIVDRVFKLVFDGGVNEDAPAK